MLIIDYTIYFWQDEVIRLRAIQPEDCERRFDTPARRLLEYSVELTYRF